MNFIDWWYWLVNVKCKFSAVVLPLFALKTWIKSIEEKDASHFSRHEQRASINRNCDQFLFSRFTPFLVAHFMYRSPISHIITLLLPQRVQAGADCCVNTFFLALSYLVCCILYIYLLSPWPITQYLRRITASSRDFYAEVPNNVSWVIHFLPMKWTLNAIRLDYT